VTHAHQFPLVVARDSVRGGTCDYPIEVAAAEAFLLVESSPLNREIVSTFL